MKDTCKVVFSMPSIIIIARDMKTGSIDATAFACAECAEDVISRLRAGLTSHEYLAHHSGVSLMHIPASDNVRPDTTRLNGLDG